MSINDLVSKLKGENQDFEFYPTTHEIIEAMYWDLKKMKLNAWYKDEKLKNQSDKYEHLSLSILDIGAGNCKILNTLQKISEENYILDDKFPNGKIRNKWDKKSNQLSVDKYMVIEKSQLLIEQMPPEALIVGTDFEENTLIDKKADVIFCNPPYSQYAKWSQRIIKEANASVVYLVIPQRWGSDRGIADAIKIRKAKVSIVGNFDFLNSEDRKARAKVSLVKIALDYNKKEKGYYYSKDTFNKATIDPFDLWFNETFKINAQKEKSEDWRAKEKKAKEKEEAIKRELVAGGDLVSTLVELYNRDLQKLIDNYTKLSELDAEIFKELNVDVKSVLAAFKEKIKGLKALYWQEIFNNLDKITERLTSKTRDSLLKTLAANTNIDFTASNIRGIVIWVIKNANKYFESQMLDLYEDLMSEDGIKLYKSNAHFQKDTWRYLKEQIKEKGIKYALDYRIVLYSCRDYMDKAGHITNKQQTMLKDLVVVAKNLNFPIADFDSSFFRLGDKEHLYFSTNKERKLAKGTKTNLGKIQEVFEDNGEYQYKIDNQIWHWSLVKKDTDIFVAFRSYKNGNIHYMFNKKFIQKLNLEVSRLKGWVKSPQEATQEFDIDLKTAQENWKGTYTLLPQQLTNLLPQHQEEAKKEDTLKKNIDVTSYSKKQLETFQEGVLFEVA